jgi:Anti-sigma-K factor rskA
MNCQDFRATYLAGQAGRDHTHVAGCAACRALLKDLDTGRAALADPALWEEPSPELGRQVEALVVAAPPAGMAPRKRRWQVPVTAAAVVATVIASAGILATRRPDWTVEIAGTELAPEAVAIASGWNAPTGTRIVLDIEGLDPAPPGLHYELWFTRDSVHISAGTFTGPGVVELWAGVARSDYPRLWVTLEQADEDSGPSRETVLDTGA